MSTAVVDVPATLPQVPSVNLMDRAVCIVVSRGMIGFTRTVRSSQVEVKAEKSMIHVTKELFDSEELKKIASLDGKISEYLASRCLPSLFKRSVYLLPTDLITEVDARLTEHLTQRKELVENFCKVYDKTVIQAQTQLQDLFDPSDYPPVEVVREAFTFTWQYVQFGVSQSLKKVSAAMFEREQAKVQSQWAEANQAIQQLLRANMATLTEHMVTILTPTDDGKKKRFHKTTLSKINDFLATFDARNLTNDAELQAVVEKAKKLTEGVTPEALRSQEALRSAMQTGFAGIKEQLKGMVTDAPGRAIRFDEE